MAQRRYSIAGTETTVVTYRMAYIDAALDLCAAHAQTVTGLGPVSHGEHVDTCDECTRLAALAAEAEEKARAAALTSAYGVPSLVRALGELAGSPVGSWGQTRERLAAVRGALPHGAPYTVDELVRHALEVDAREYYVARPRLTAASRALRAAGAL